MNTLSEKQSQMLSLNLKRAVIEALTASCADDAAWAGTLSALRRHGLLETVVAAPFTRLGFSREPISVDRQRLSDPYHLEDVSGRIAVELFHIIRRDVDDGSALALATMTGPQLVDVLGRLYINQSDGRGIARALLEKPVNAAIAGSPEVEKIFAALDTSFDAIGRGVGRELDRSAREAQERLDRATADAHERLNERTRLAILELEHSRCDKPGEAKVAVPTPDYCNHCCTHRGREALVEENCRRFLKQEELSGSSD